MTLNAPSRGLAIRTACQALLAYTHLRSPTRHPVLRLLLRLLFVGIALLLRNLWVWIHWRCLTSPRRGGRQLNPDKLRFRTLLLWLANAAWGSAKTSDHFIELISAHQPIPFTLDHLIAQLIELRTQSDRINMRVFKAFVAIIEPG